MERTTDMRQLKEDLNKLNKKYPDFFVFAVERDTTVYELIQGNKPNKPRCKGA